MKQVLLNQTHNNKLIACLSRAQKKFSAFFGFKLDIPAVFFVESRTEVDQIFKRKTEPWLSAWVKNDSIFTLDPKIYTRESIHEANHFWGALQHEYCHLYFCKLTGVNFPKWLNEGVACYLAGQKKQKPIKVNALKITDFYFKNLDKYIYGVGYFWVELLINRFGKSKLLRLIKTINPSTTQNEFAKNFLEVFKFQLKDEELKNFLNKGNGCK